MTNDDSHHIPGDLVFSGRVRNRIMLGEHHLYDCAVAGLLALSGCARGAAGLTKSEAETLLEQFVASIDELEAAAVADRDPLAEDGPDVTLVSIARNILASQSLDIIERLTGTVDWKNRALQAEDSLEAAEHNLGVWESGIREFCGPEARSVGQIRMLLDSLRGSVLASEHQRAEQAAFALDLLEHLRRFPSNEMSEGLENIHHAICASPRTAESEAQSYAYLEEAIEAKAYERVVALGNRYQAVMQGYEKTILCSEAAIEAANSALGGYRATAYEQEAALKQVTKQLSGVVPQHLVAIEALERRVVARFWTGILVGFAGGVAALLILRAIVS